jgi:hypothetical protein
MSAMRALLLALVAVYLTVVAVAPASATAPRPSVTFASLTPGVKVRGAHFRPRERVKVTLRVTSLTRVRSARASAAGRFVVDFGALARSRRCGGPLTIVAVGAGGERAFRALPPIECPAPVAAMTALPGH